MVSSPYLKQGTITLYVQEREIRSFPVHVWGESARNICHLVGSVTGAVGQRGIYFLYSVNRNTSAFFGIQRRLGFLHIGFISTPVIGTDIREAP